MLQELPFYDELNIAKSSNAFSGYARISKIKIIDDRDPLVQLEASKLSINDLFKNLLNEIKGFKYQVTVTVLLSKVKMDGNIKYGPVYFNSITKTVVNYEFSLINHFKRFCPE